MKQAWRVRVWGVVQGVGFRPFVYRLAQAYGLGGWVRNDEEAVEMHVEGPSAALEAFLEELSNHPPPAARIDRVVIEEVAPEDLVVFEIRESAKRDRPTVRISPDLAVCPACLKELFDPQDRRYLYPYINCTNCGPRYSIVLALPYDRSRTTMKAWALCPVCAREYEDPLDRRFHAQPIACPACGPHYFLREEDRLTPGDEAAIRRAVELLREGRIIAVKGLGGYHLACDAENAQAVQALRERKYRKEKPFALMVRDLEIARALIELTPEAEALLTSSARPILLAPARRELPGVAPENRDLGVMLPYTPLHYLLFHYGAPPVLVMTSANRSSEPMAYRDEEALEKLSGIADAFLIGERPIARRVDDSVVRVGTFGPLILRRARGYAPAMVARLPLSPPLLAVGADLKNAVTLVVEGQALMSQHLGDLEHYEAFIAFQEAVQSLLSVYELEAEEIWVVHDLHPQYRSTAYALSLSARSHYAVQHHQAHVAAVLAERGAFEERVVGVAFDGTGYGEDGAIWGGEFFLGSLAEGLTRVGHLRYAALPGGDAAARFPIQAAVGFLDQIEEIPDLTQPPFSFSERYLKARELLRSGLRVFPTTSVGRLFDTVAALLGFAREITFEGQAAIWLEHLARKALPVKPYPFPWNGKELDFRPLLEAVLWDRARGRDPSEIARAFHRGLAQGLVSAAVTLAEAHGAIALVLSGGVFQNALLLEEIRAFLREVLPVWLPREVPPNDGGISLGQAALATFSESLALDRTS
ncbi:carbamoyltransferase HypF [Thermus oshimai]|uniref:carbamoyltransferase HypF n=1 Tax=Thermus oshimai TaxID=56957 RepID=UPI00039E9B1E|nr:carbamoyltransferase HypF [Thermus oshimai]